MSKVEFNAIKIGFLTLIGKWIKGAVKSKTINFAMLLGVFVSLSDQLDIIQEFMTPENFKWFNLCIAIAIIILRSITKESILDKSKPKELPVINP